MTRADVPDDGGPIRRVATAFGRVVTAFRRVTMAFRRPFSGRARTVGSLHLAAAGFVTVLVGLGIVALAATNRLAAWVYAVSAQFLSGTALLEFGSQFQTIGATLTVLGPLLVLFGAKQLRDARAAYGGREIGLVSAAAGLINPLTAPLCGIAAVLLLLAGDAASAPVSDGTDSDVSDGTESGRSRAREAVLVGAVVLVGYSLAVVPVVAGLGGAAAAVPGGDDPDAANGSLSDGTAGVEAPGDIQFREVSAAAGIDYEATSTYRGSNGMISDAGAYVLDYDDDGFEDVLLLGGQEPALYANDDGRFERSDALPEVNGSVRAALVFDYDNDGWEDLLLLRTDATAVFLENSEGSFERADVGLSTHFDVPIGASAADYTGNGCLDVLVVQYGDWIEAHPAGELDYDVSDAEENGNPNYLFAGDCADFEDVTGESGLAGERWTLAASFTDLTGDGRPDVHVANDFNYDYVYRNQGNGTFQRVRLGERTNRNGMSSEVTDVNGDGLHDVFTTNIYFPGRVEQKMATTMQFRADGNNLLVNQGDGSFVDRADEYGVVQGGWGWAAVSADLDNDGLRDLFHTTRHMTFSFTDGRFSEDERRRLHAVYSFYEYPVLFERTGDEFVTRNPAEAGFEKADGRGTVAFDYDRDGDVDLLVANAEGTYQLYENAVTGRNAVQVDVRGRTGTTAVGATVTVTIDGGSQRRIRTVGSDFLSQDSRVAHFGLDDANPVVVTVRWADGTERTFTDIRSGERIVVSPDGIERRTEFEERSDDGAD